MSVPGDGLEGVYWVAAEEELPDAVVAEGVLVVGLAGVAEVVGAQVELLEERHGGDEAVDGGPVEAVPVEDQLAHLEADGVRVAQQRAAQQVAGQVEELLERVH